MTRRKQPAASRVRYAADHPTIGVHVDKETYEKLLELRKRSGMSFGRLVLQDLGVVEMDIAKVEANAFERGRRSGYAAAKAEYSLKVPCYVCGEPMQVRPLSEVSRAAARAGHRWGHEACCLGRPPRLNRRGGARS
jgi:hypothetical protein